MSVPQPGPVVLVVDDEDGVRHFASRALQTAGYRVIEASDASDALKVLKKETPIDVLLTDIRMPGMNGNELARRFRQARPDLKVLYLSGFVDTLFENRQFLWEDEAFLDKPFTIKGLLEAVSLLECGRLTPASA